MIKPLGYVYLSGFLFFESIMTMTWHEESTPYTLEVLSTPPANLRDDTYKVRRYEMRTIITLPNADAKVWGRGAGKESWGLMPEDTIPDNNNRELIISSSNPKVQYGIGGCEVVPDSRNGMSVTLRTYIYRVEETNGNITQGTWFPCPPQDVRYYYTILKSLNNGFATLEKKSSFTSASQAPIVEPNTHTIEKSRKTELLPVYPNPSDNQIFLDFAVSAPAMVEFAVTDILGNIVHHISEQYFVPGEHTLGYTPNTLPNGTYTLRMSVRYSQGTIEYKLRQFTLLR